MTIRTTRDLGDWILPSVWALRNRVIGGRPIQFYSTKRPLNHRPWSVAPLDDGHPRITIKKARQLGFTELNLAIKALHLATMVPTTTVYTLPTAPKAEEIARERLHPLGSMSETRRLSERMIARIADWKAYSIKKFKPRFGGGTSTILVSGSWYEGLGESTAADAVYLDELDRMFPNVISAFDKSLSSSQYGFLRAFSTPTLPNHGVAALYDQSDKKRFMYKCTRCKCWQYLTRENIAQTKGPTSLIQRLEAHDKTAVFQDGTFIYKCIHCNRPLNRMAAFNEWVAERPEITTYSGYALSQLDAVWISADAIMKDLLVQQGGLRAWYNYTLGLEYMGDGGSVIEGWVLTLVNPLLPAVQGIAYYKAHYTNVRVSIGIDWGKRNWATVLIKANESPYPIAAHFEEFTDTTDPLDAIRWVVNLAETWQADVVIADAGYGADRNPHLWKHFGGKFFACQYLTSRRESRVQQTSEPSFGPNPPPITQSTAVVTVDKVASIKTILAALRRREFQFAPLGLEKLEEIDKHFRNLAIVIDTNKKGIAEEMAVSLGDDHYLNTFNYANIGLTWLEKGTAHIFDMPYGDNALITNQDTHLVEMPTGEEIAYLASYFDDFNM